MSVDPLGEKYNWQTNYSFCSNQVVQSREIEGLEADYDQNDYDNYYNNDYLDHTGESNWQPAGFDGGLGPMDGQLDEVVVGNSYKEVFDKYDQIDKDRDGYGGKDDYDFELTHGDIDHLGEILFWTGAFFTATGVLSEIGIPLMALGGDINIANTVVKDGSKFFDEDGFTGKDLQDSIIDVSLIAVPISYEREFGRGIDYYLIEAVSQSSSEWFNFMNELHK